MHMTNAMMVGGHSLIFVRDNTDRRQMGGCRNKLACCLILHFHMHVSVSK